jgi:hypothetical protein
MAHFAELDNINHVINVVVLGENDVNNLPFPQSESVGIEFLNNIFPGKTWKQTSYNNNFRFRYAGVGFEFHPECGEHGGFCPSKPYDDWLFDNIQCLWVPPKPRPADSNEVFYKWNPIIHDWEKIEPPQGT